MSVTTLRRGADEWTLDELDAMPDDGLQYELLDGLLLVTPAPVLLHQRAIGNLYLPLRAGCPPELEVLMSPVDWRPDRRTSLQPDLLVYRRADFEPKNITAGLVLAVEVLSPSTRRKDLVLKRSKYEDASVPSYWIVDPAEPSITALDLVGGRYVETVRAAGAAGDGVAAMRSLFPVSVTPSALFA